MLRPHAMVLLGILWLCACATSAIQPDPIYRETQIRQARPRVAGDVFDAQETDVRLTSSFDEADRLAERAVSNVPRDERFILAFWKAKKKILKRRFGVDWQSPAELTPDLDFDGYGERKITAEEEAGIRRALAPELRPGEAIHGIWREFDGEVRASLSGGARTSEDGTTALGTPIYFLVRHGDAWHVSARGELIID